MLEDKARPRNVGEWSPCCGVSENMAILDLTPRTRCLSPRLFPRLALIQQSQRTPEALRNANRFCSFPALICRT